MRIWHKDLLTVLPDNQFKGQNRELVAILHKWRDGKTNHILNKVMDYDRCHLGYYAELYYTEYFRRYNKVNPVILDEFFRFCFPESDGEFYIKPHYNSLFANWHNDIYLKECLCNLEEKYLCGGITDKEWNKIFDKFSNKFKLVNTKGV